ncbi:4881_t:CDS:2 [Entrophospora sp. SA101]|nr:4881_t:CDS:2 [Entrophospora sp. SA101]
MAVIAILVNIKIFFYLFLSNGSSSSLENLSTYVIEKLGKNINPNNLNGECERLDALKKSINDLYSESMEIWNERYNEVDVLRKSGGIQNPVNDESIIVDEPTVVDEYPVNDEPTIVDEDPVNDELINDEPIIKDPTDKHIIPPEGNGIGSGGVKRISSTCYEDTRDTLKLFLKSVIEDAVIYTNLAKRKTIKYMDIVYALKKRGIHFYGFNR